MRSTTTTERKKRTHDDPQRDGRCGVEATVSDVHRAKHLDVASALDLDWDFRGMLRRLRGGHSRMVDVLASLLREGESRNWKRGVRNWTE